MDDNNEEDDTAVLANLSDKSDMAVVDACERELQEMLQWDNLGNEMGEWSRKNNKSVEKRLREESEESNYYDDEGYTTVMKRKPKRLLRSNSNKQKENTTTGWECKDAEVCVTSLNTLPKQMALAKLLKSEKIGNIIRIKYKSPYKVLINFENKDQAELLLKCPKFTELGFRCQLAFESSRSYGVVKGIDLDMEDKEIMEAFESDCKIISIDRLKRLNNEGKWIKSESIRICFDSPSLPSYVVAYGCRFKVERYVFPVTQCSGCWKFGHLRKFCPSKTIKCPKCGENHENCDIKDVKCLNCKGDHIVLDKSCPIFIKEKNIRHIMSEQNVTYRKALQTLLTKEPKSTPTWINDNRHTQSSVILPTSQTLTKRSYSSVVSKDLTKAIIHREQTDTDSEYTKQTTRPQSQRKPRKSKGNKKTAEKTQEVSTENIKETSNQDKRTEEIAADNEQDQEKRRKRKFDLKKILLKLQEIVLSNAEFETKIVAIIGALYEEFKSFILNCLCGGDLIQSILQLFYGQKVF